MSTAKKDNTVAPEVTTPETEGAETPTQEGTKKKTTTAKKDNTVYKFTSANKYLSCNGLGVQFINGEATTTNVEVAKALVKIEGVELVEDK